jgi:hypothetical protein
LFVTTPISKGGHATLVVISSVSPERTRLLTLQGDGEENSLYDSYRDGNECTVRGLAEPLRVVYAMAVESSVMFRMRESGNSPRDEGERLLKLELGPDSCVISEATPNQ